MGKTKTQFIGDQPEADKVTKSKKSQKSEKKDKVHLSGQKGGERVKLVEAAPTEPVANEEQARTKTRQPRVRGKKYKAAKNKVDNSKIYPPNEAISLAKETSISEFDGTLELHLVTRKVGLSFTVSLPHSTGKSKKVEIADESTIKKLEDGKVDFDVLLATPEMMPRLVPFARILGPRGLMPNPKNGTIVKSKKDAEGFSAGKVTIKAEKKSPVIHTIVGKVSMKDSDLLENTEAIMNAVGKRQVIKAYLASTMGPSVKVAVPS